MHEVILFVLLASTYLMVIAKRTPALIRSFRYQSLCLFALTFVIALTHRQPDLYIIAGLLFVLKVSLIPHLLYRIIRRIKAHEDLGLFINPQLSLLGALGFTYLSWIFASYLVNVNNAILTATLAIAFL